MSDGNGKILSGQQYDPSLGIVKRFTQQMLRLNENGLAAAKTSGAEGDAATELIPVDEAAQRATVFDVSQIQTDMAAIYTKGETTVNLTAKLPSVLTGLSVVFTKDSGAGASNHPATQQYFLFLGSSGSGGVQPTASAEGSAAIVGDLIPVIVDPFAPTVPATVYTFYMAENSTRAQVLARLTALAGATVNDWPKFKPVALNFIVKGGQVALRQSADSTAHIAVGPNGGSANKTFGDSYSRSVGVTSRSIEIRPTIHAAITIASATDSATATVDVDADTILVSGTSGSYTAAVAAYANNPAQLSDTANGSVTPDTVAATTIASIPTTGLYVAEIDYGEGDYDMVKYRVAVVDFSWFA